MTADWRSWSQELRALNWSRQSGLLRSDGQRKSRIRNCLEPIGGVLVVGGVALPERQPVRLLRVKPCMDMRLLVGVMVFADPKLVNVGKGSFDQPEQERQYQRDCVD